MILMLLQKKLSSINNENKSSKIPFTPKGGRFCEENFLKRNYLDLCYVNPTYQKLKTLTLYYRL